MPTIKSAKLLSRLAVGVTAVAAIGLSGCSAGQVTQTDVQVAPIDGTNGSIVEEGIDIAIRDVVVHYDSLEGYAKGGNAPIEVYVFNNGRNADTLESVTANVADSVTLVSSAEEETPADDPSSPQGSDSAQEGTQSPDETNENGTGEENGSGEGTESADEAQQDTKLGLELAPGAHIALTPGHEQYLQLTGLTEDLKSGSTVTLTFKFAKAGKETMTIPMASPTEPAERETADIDQGH